jgi:hypothetical protein
VEVPEDAGYFAAQFRRVNPLPYKQVYTIVDNLKGKGHYVGTYLAWGVNNSGWWGEGEIKFYMDGDRQFPTIVGTGTEDYFCGSYNFENKEKREYETFTTPYTGLAQVIKPKPLLGFIQPVGLDHLAKAGEMVAEAAIFALGELKVPGAAEVILGAGGADGGEIAVAV